MPENFRAVIVVLGLAIPLLLFLRPQLTAAATTPYDYSLRARLWVALTLAVFLAHNFWLFVLLVVLAVLVFGRRDSNPLGLYFFLLLLAPPVPATIPGIGGINYFLALDYLRLLSLVILLPHAVRLARDPLRAPLFSLPSDKFFIGYLVLQVAIRSSATTTTDTVRWTVSLFIDVFLPYYVFSRGLSDHDKMRDAFAAFVAGASALALVAMFESARGWLLYLSVPDFLGVPWDLSTYMMREGAVRATASAGHSIILGFVLFVALGLHLALRSSFRSGRAWGLLLLILLGGIFATASRGPWVGAAAVVVTALILSPARASNITKLGLASIVVVPVMLLSPVGARIVALLPFVGSAAGDSVDYRQQLFNISWDVLMLNPFFGSPDFINNESLGQLRLSGGLIDMVNSYLGVAMYSGFVGLAFFGGVFATVAIGLLSRLTGKHRVQGSEQEIGIALLATLVGVLVAIATLSSINAVPVVYWCLAGACAAFLRWAGSEAAEPDAPASQLVDSYPHAIGARPAGLSSKRI